MKRLWNTTSRRIGILLAVVVLTLCGRAPAAANQVPFTATGTAAITGVSAPAGRADPDELLEGTERRPARGGVGTSLLYFFL